MEVCYRPFQAKKVSEEEPTSHVDAFVRDTETLRCDLDHLSVQSLSHFSASMGHQHCPVCVDMHQRASLVHELRCEIDPKLRGNNCKSSLSPFVFFVECIDCCATSRYISFLVQFLPKPRYVEPDNFLTEMRAIS